MKNRFVISENDRRSILSMYGLLKEDITKINISGTIKDSEGKLKVFENIRLNIIITLYQKVFYKISILLKCVKNPY